VKPSLYGIEAIASDDSGLISRDVVHITVSNVPKVTLVGPSEKAPLKVKSITEIQVDATELGGTIRDIEIYANDVLLEKGPLMQPRTYSFRWQPLRPGEYTLRAVAINEVGIRRESKTVHVVVRD
jgi:hypothetical protein